MPPLPPIRTDDDGNVDLTELVGESLIKPAAASLTLRGIMLATVALIAQMLGFDLPVEHLEITVNTIAILVGLIIAAWGRLRAHTMIRGVVRLPDELVIDQGENPRQ